jgi:hypothetical protein
VAAGAKWCGGAWSSSLSSEVKVYGLQGLGNNQKCTWQFIASTNSKAPAFEMTGKANKNSFLLQVIEWADHKTFTAGSTLNTWADSVLNKKFYFVGLSTTIYKPVKGSDAALNKAVFGSQFFNPIKAITPAKVSNAFVKRWNGTDANSVIETGLEKGTVTLRNAGDSKAISESYRPGSLGMAQYHDRSVMFNNELRFVDSYWIGQSTKVFNNVLTSYNK